MTRTRRCRPPSRPHRPRSRSQSMRSQRACAPGAPRLRRRRLVRPHRCARRGGVRGDLLHPARPRRRTRRRRRDGATARAGSSRGRPGRRRTRPRGARHWHRGRDRRRERERIDALRRSARSRPQHAAGALTACVVCAPQLGARRSRRARDRSRRRAGVPRRIDPPQGRNRAEARPQHDLDDLDDPAREDVREPHGRRRRREREARRTASAGSSAAASGASATEIDDAIAAPTATRVSRSSAARAGRCRGPHASGSPHPGRSIADALEARREARRRSRTRRRAARSGRRRGPRRARGRLRPLVAERPGHRRARVRRPPGQRLRRRRLPHRRHRRISAGGRSAPRDRRHCLPPDVHHLPRRAAPRRPPRGACRVGRAPRPGRASRRAVHLGPSPRDPSSRPRVATPIWSCSTACWKRGPSGWSRSRPSFRARAG